MSGFISFSEASADTSITFSIAGSSNITLTSSQYNNAIIRLTGIITGDINVVFPLISGRKWEVYNNTTGAFKVTAIGATGTGIYLPQYSKTSIETDYSATNIEYASGQGQGMEWLFPVDLTGTGTINTALIKLPDTFRLVRSEFKITDTLVGGTVIVSLGVASGGVTIINSQSVGAINTLIGDESGQLGSDMSSARNYEAYFTSTTTIWLKKVITGTITTGSANIYLAGYMI